MKRFFLVFLLIVILVGIAAAVANAPKPSRSGIEHERTEVAIGSHRFTAYISDTEALRARGLSVFSRLRADEAMLFVFESSAQWGFWMKDMRFPIDIVWIGDDSRIVSIEESVSPETYPKTFFPKAPALYVVELSAGTVERIGAKVGDEVSIGISR